MKKWNTIKKTCSSLIYFAWYSLFVSNRGSARKALFIDIPRNGFTRYLYAFAKFFHLNGYDIYIPRKFLLFYDLHHEPYASLLLKEKIIRIGKPLSRQRAIQLNRKTLSPDYFSSPNNKGSVFHIPMTQHPLMYHHHWWKTPLEQSRRIRSIFMAGNFAPELYDEVESEGIFNVVSRVTIKNYLERKDLLLNINTINELIDFLEHPADGNVVVTDRRHVAIPMDRLREVLSKFEFYFAMPGVVMPFSHNIIEAISAGCIPFLQGSYAALFNPSLIENVHVITFNDLDDLPEKIDHMLTLSPERIVEMRTALMIYYNQYLTPQYIVGQIEKNNFSCILLQAEHLSVRLKKQNIGEGFIKPVNKINL